MIKNWYEYTPDELKQRTTKLFNWATSFPQHPKAKEAWLAIAEISQVMELKDQSKTDTDVARVIQHLCL